MYSEMDIREYDRWTEAEAARRAEEAQRFPMGDSAAKLARMALFESHGERTGKERAIAMAIEMWMNGASDHFYDLDRERAPAVLCELADLTLKIGHGFSDETWTIETVDRIRELWRESCLAVDRQLGTEPDWGSW